MIQLTESAAGKVKELLVEEGRSDIALRVAVQPGGCSGLRYAMYLDDQLTEKDVAEEQFGVRVVIDRMSVPYLSEAKIDFVDSLEASGFTIDNPVAQGSCACGHSFLTTSSIRAFPRPDPKALQAASRAPRTPSLSSSSSSPVRTSAGETWSAPIPSARVRMPFALQAATARAGRPGSASRASPANCTAARTPVPARTSPTSG
jgi:iron-sulfur cluster assembly accessory protein